MRTQPRRLLLLIGAMMVLAVASWFALQSTGMIYALARGPLGLLVQAATVSEAHAQAMKFEPVPSESVSQFERRRARARQAERSARDARAEEDVEVIPEAPEVDEVPPVPDVPSIPLTSKSGNITRIGSDIEIARDQVVVGDVVAVGGDVTVEGRVEGDVAAMGGDVHLTSTARVEGDVVCMGGRLVEEPGAEVGGQRVSGLGRGRRVEIENPRREERHSSDGFGGSMAWLLVMLGAAWGFAGLGPGRTGAAAQTLRADPLLCLGIGALVFALIIPSIVALALVVALLCITIIGIPVALAAMLAYVLFLGIVWLWGYVVSATVVGQWIQSRRSGAVTAPGAPASASPSLLRSALFGVLFLNGAIMVGKIFKQLGPFGGLGTLIVVLGSIAFCVAVVIGSGAWIRSEVKTGSLLRWWRGGQWGRRSAGAPVPEPPPPPPPPPPPHPPAAAAPVAPQAYSAPPPSPSTSYMPPEPPAAAGQEPTT